MQKKRVIALFVALCLILGLAPVAMAAEEMIFDTSSGYYTETGSWDNSPGVKGYHDGPTKFAYGENSYATWQPELLKGGIYRVSIWNVVHETNLEELKVEIKDNKGVHTVSYQHKDVEPGFVELGEFEFSPGASGYVKVDASESNAGVYARVSCLKYELIEENPDLAPDPEKPPEGEEPSGQPAISEMIYDTSSGCFLYEGKWDSSPSLKGYQETTTLYSYGIGTATWQPELITGGKYRVSVWNVVHSGNTAFLKMEVKDKNGVQEFTIPHRSGQAGFVTLGEFEFDAGADGYVRAVAENGEYMRVNSVKYELLETGGSATVLVPLEDPEEPSYAMRDISSKEVDVADAADCAVKFYVQIGADGDGSEENPFGSIAQAQAKVKEVIAAGIPEGGIGVYLRGGTYALEDTFTLTQQDSGKEGSPVIWQAYPGEQVTLTGATVLDNSNFHPVTDPEILNRLPASGRGKVYETDLSLAGIGQLEPMDLSKSRPYMLVMGDRAGTIARWPNEGYSRTGNVTDASSRMDSGPRKKGFTYEIADPRPLRWLEAEDPWLKGYWVTPYDLEYSKVTSIDPEGMKISGKHSTIYGAYGNSRYFAINLLEEIDQEGEWYADVKTNKLYCYPYPGWETQEISFAHDIFDMIRMEGASNVAVRSFKITASGGNGLVIDHSSSNCSGIGLEIIHVSGDGAQISGRNNTLRDCDISFVGNIGVSVSGGDEFQLIQSGNLIDNNVIHDTGVTGRYQYGIGFSGCGQTITHNHIYNLGARALNGSGLEHTIEYNVMERTNLEMSDSGALYYGSPGMGYGTKIRYNLVRDSVGLLAVPGFSAEGAMGLYLDTNTSGVDMSYNLLIGMTENALFVNCGRDNKVNNNILIGCSKPLTVARDTAVKAVAPGGIVETNIKRYPYDQEPFLSKYPTLKTVFEDDFGYAVNCEVKNNVKFDSGEYSFQVVPEKRGIAEGNLSFDSLPDCDLNTFYDFDYTLIKQQNPDFEELPIEEMGTYTGGARTDTQAIVFNNQAEAFTMDYPAKEAANIDPNTTLKWSAGHGGVRSYSIYLAEDPEFENLALINSTQDTSIDVSLEYGKTYYWRVKSKPMLGYEERWNDGGVYSFTTMSAEDKLLGEIKSAELLLQSTEEGTQPGQFGQGSKSQLQKAYDEGNQAMAGNSLEEKQKAIENLSEEMKSYLEKQVVSQTDLKTLVFDDYTLDTAGERPLGLFLRSYSLLDVTAQSDPLNAKNKVVRWLDSNPYYHFGQRYFESQNRYLEASTSVMPAQKDGAFAITLMKTGVYAVEAGTLNSIAAKVVFAPDGMIYGDRKRMYPLMPYEENTWYNIKLAVDFDNRVYDVFVDNVKMAEDIAFDDPSVAEVNQIVFDTSDGTVANASVEKSTRGTFYTDNTVVKAPRSQGRNGYLTGITINQTPLFDFDPGTMIYQTDLTQEELEAADIQWSAGSNAAVKLSQENGRVCITVLSGDRTGIHTYVLIAKQ